MSFLPTIPVPTTAQRLNPLQHFGLLFLFLLAGFSTPLRAEAPVTGLPGDTTIEASICSNETYDFNGQVLNQAGTYEVLLTASDGTDSTVTLILSVLPVSLTSLQATICEDETYSFNGQVLNMTGIYFAVLSAFNGCDSTVTLSLLVRPLSKTILNETICAGESFNFGGVDLINPGVYTQVYTAFNGCDSVVTLFLEVLPSPHTNLNIGICIGSFYTFDGQQLTQSGTYTAVYPAFNGCDSTVTLNLAVVAFFDIHLNESICEGESYNFGGLLLNLPGVYVDFLKAYGGCDSTVTLNLSVYPHVANAVHASICAGDTFIFGNDTLSTGGVYVDSLTTTHGCDSIVTLTLVVLPNYTTAVQANLCDNETYDFNGQILTDAGVYTQTLQAFNGCDSTVTLTLSILPVPKTELSATICDGDEYNFNGEIITDAGVHTQTFTAFNGCDSLVNLTLTVLPVAGSNIVASICEGETYSFNGEELNGTGEYTAVYTAFNGCDSTVTLFLSVLPVSEIALEASICEGGFYLFDGEMLTDPGNYTAVFPAFNGCDSTVTLALFVLPNFATTVNATICNNETYDFNGEILEGAGTYTAYLIAVNGCDSIVTLNLSVLPTFGTDVFVDQCEGTTYLFDGQLLTDDGVYLAFLTAFNGCDSVVRLHIDFVPFYAEFTIATICEGESFPFGGQNYTQSGEYVQNLVAAGGCDSTLTLFLTVNPVEITNIQASICNGETYLFDGTELDQAGSYSAVYQTFAGCDSTVNLTLSVLPNSFSLEQATICDGETYLFNGQEVFEEGAYTVVLQAANGCDSTVVLSLTVLPISETLLQTSICEGEVYDFNGTDLTASGIYIDVLTAFNGCDSVIALQLFVLPVSGSQITGQICNGDSYNFNGTELDQSGTYTSVQTGFNGCDSTVTLTLTVAPELSTNLNENICEGETFVFDGQDLTASGIYTATYTAQGGCDSIVTLNLNVHPAEVTHLNVDLCNGDTYPFNGQILDQSGTYTASLQTTYGCDSTVTLNLLVLPANTTALDTATCNGDSFEFSGIVLDQSGSYQFHFIASNGCDSMVTVNLTINPVIPPTVTLATICQGETYDFYGQNLTAGGAYTEVLSSVHGCDSTIGLLLTVLPNAASSTTQTLCEGDSTFFNGNYVTAPGVYTAVYPALNGCDSIVTLNLLVTPVDNGLILQGSTLIATAQNATYIWFNCATGLPIPNEIGQTYTPEESGSYAVFVTQNGCGRLSDCMPVIGTATNEPASGIQWQLAPNPAVSETTIRFGQPLTSDCTIELVDASGKILRSERIQQGAVTHTLELTGAADGILFVRLNDGQNVVVKRLVKN